MSTDLHDRPAKPSDEGPDKPEPRRPAALSVAQVVGGALAAMTAAALGSRLSVAGTVVGAALASVVAAVAGSVYTSSLRRTSQHVTKVIANRRPCTDAAGPATGVPGATGSSPTAVQHPVPATSGTRTGWDWDEAGTTTTPVAGPDAIADPASKAGATQGRRPRWRPVVLGALLMFVIAAVVLTGFELATGRTLSGGSGTTVGRVAEGRTDPAPRPSSTSSATPRATAGPSASATAAPLPSGSSTPSSGPTAAPSTSESAAPSASPTPSASAAPSSSVTPGVAPTA